MEVEEDEQNANIDGDGNDSSVAVADNEIDNNQEDLEEDESQHEPEQEQQQIARLRLREQRNQSNNNNALGGGNNSRRSLMLVLTEDRDLVNQQRRTAVVVVERLPRSNDIITVNDDNSDQSSIQEIHGEHVQEMNQLENVAAAPGVSNSDDAGVAIAEVHRTTPSSSKKRKRSKSSVTSPTTQSTTMKKHNYSLDEDDGSMCPICLDHWEMSGPHRLTSLKCGHLFGHSCIRRWLSECAPGSRSCPSCKTKAAFRDMRYLYAKRVCAIDNTEEHRLRDLLEIEKKKTAKMQDDCTMLKLDLALTKNRVIQLEADIERIQRTGGGLGAWGSGCYPGTSDNSSSSYAPIPLVQYKLFMEKNVEISKEPGCRVMAFGVRSRNIIVSQKSTQSLFPGYGVRFIDAKTFKPTNFLHMSTKSIRDLSFSSEEDFLVSATMEKSAKLFNVRDRMVTSVFTPSDEPLWTCALDKELSNFLYLGSQHGSTYIYDIRYSSTVVEEFKNEGDLTPVINICLVPGCNLFPFGGFLVCKLQSIWFYEKIASQEIIATKLNIEGPFISVNYNPSTNIILISTRPNIKSVNSRYIVGELKKINDVVVFATTVAFYGSKVTPVMSRCTQIAVKDNTLVAAYLQDVKLLSLWDLRESCRIQSLPVSDIVYDTCPVYVGDQTYLAALTETKCRIYKVITSD